RGTRSLTAIGSGPLRSRTGEPRDRPVGLSGRRLPRVRLTREQHSEHRGSRPVHVRGSCVAAPRLLSTRNFDALYNVACTIRAFRLVQDRWPDASLTLVGGGP